MPPSPESPRERSALAWLLFIIGFLYLISFDLKGIWTDEGLRIQLMNGNRTWQQQMTSPEFATYSEVLEAIAPLAYQPFYYLLGNALFRLGNTDSELLVRGINVLFLFGCLFGLLRFARKWDWRTRIFLVLVYGVNGYLMMHVMQIREYLLYQLILIWSSVIFFEMLEMPIDSPARKFWMHLGGYCLLVIVGYYTHTYLLLVFPVQAIFVFFRKDDRKRFMALVFGAYGVAAMAALPWIRYAYGIRPNRHDAVTLDFRPSTLTNYYSDMIAGFRSVLAYAHEQPGSWVDGYAIVAGACVFFGIFQVIRKWRETDLRVAFGAMTLLGFAGFQTAYFFLRQPMSTWSRYFIGDYFGVCVVLAFAFQMLLSHSDALKEGSAAWRLAPGLAFGLTAFAGVTQIERFRDNPYKDTILSKQCNWDDPSRILMSVTRPEDVVVFYHPMQAWTMSRYYRGLATESSFDQVLHGVLPPSKVVWVLDTGVEQNRVPQVYGKLQSLAYKQTSSQDLGCRTKLVRFENSNWTEGNTPAGSFGIGGHFEQRQKDFKALETALTAYHEDHGAYPQSSGGFDGYFSNYGKSLNDWIPGLAPKYIKQLPRDPRMMEKADPQYYYWSDGTNYKLIVHLPEDCNIVRNKIPSFIDPIRSCWSYGIWTKGAARR